MYLFFPTPLWQESFLRAFKNVYQIIYYFAQQISSKIFCFVLFCVKAYLVRFSLYKREMLYNEEIFTGHLAIFSMSFE